MPLSFSTAMLVEKNKRQSTHPWIWLWQVEITGAGGPLRLAMYGEPVVFHGETFAPMAMQVDALEDATHAALVNLRVTFEDVSQTMIALFEAYWVTAVTPVWTILQWQVDPFMPDEMPFGRASVYSIQQVSTDLKSAVAELVLEGVTLTSIIPKNRYISTNGFRHLPRRQ
jgi:hypothetical protein